MRALVAFYSRTGKTRRVAEAVAGALRARGAEVEVEEMVGLKRRSGLLGALLAGKDAVLGASAQIAPPRHNPGNFDIVAVGTPIWAWTAAPPVLTYCRLHCVRAKRAGFFCTMAMFGDSGAFAAMNRAMQNEPAATLALNARQLRDEAGLQSQIDGFAAGLCG